MNLITHQVPGFPRTAAEDTVLTTTSTDGKDTPISIPVPKDTRVFIDVVGLHYNRESIRDITLSSTIQLISNAAKYWEDPYEFRPERFLGDYNRDAFMPFAAGPRACLGRRYV
jgi:hypothetical protein